MSEVKVNKISPRTNCGTVTVGDSGDSVSVTAGVPVTVNGDLKSNALKATDGGVIISQSGTNITIGASGDTVSLASGASQSGFGRSGSVDWQTGSIKTATFTATSGEGYFCNTSGGAFTVNLPAGSAGAIVSLADYTRTFQTNNLTVTPNGSDKIGGQAGNASLSTEGQAITLVYVDSTEGWINVQNAQDAETGATFITATGGTITTSGNCKIHTFTGPGTFCVSQISNTPANNQVSYVVVAGGGGGGGSALGYYSGGGGGAGGYREDKSSVTPYTASPLDGAGDISVTATAFPITVGGGGGSGTGSGGPSAPPVRSGGSTGSNSSFSTITSAGGGGGGKSGSNPAPVGTAAGGNGGSGGGGGGYNSHPAGARGLGNQPPVSPGQGFNGGQGNGPATRRGGGGGGATASGEDAPTFGAHDCPGGAGAASSITGSPVTRSVGGNGGASESSEADNGAANTGNGGQGGNNCSGDADGGTGGSGVVIIRYKFQ